MRKIIRYKSPTIIRGINAAHLLICPEKQVGNSNPVVPDGTSGKTLMVTPLRILQRLLTFLTLLPVHRSEYGSICIHSVSCARLEKVVVCDLGSIFYLVCG